MVDTHHFLQVFDYCNISHHHIDAAKQAMNTDSQAGTKLSQEWQQTRVVWRRDEAVVSRCNTLCRRLNLPMFDEDFRLNEDKSCRVLTSHDA